MQQLGHRAAQPGLQREYPFLEPLAAGELHEQIGIGILERLGERVVPIQRIVYEARVEIDYPILRSYIAGDELYVPLARQEDEGRRQDRATLVPDPQEKVLPVEERHP